MLSPTIDDCLSFSYPSTINIHDLTTALATSKRKRTPEHRDIIKQARIHRNRLAAHTSREKRKLLLEEKDVVNAELEGKVERLEGENKALREQVAALAKIVLNLQQEGQQEMQTMQMLPTLRQQSVLFSPPASSLSSSPSTSTTSVLSPLPLPPLQSLPSLPPSSASLSSTSSAAPLFTFSYPLSTLGQGEPTALSLLVKSC